MTDGWMMGTSASYEYATTTTAGAYFDWRIVAR
jgi:hypothetical protein